MFILEILKIILYFFVLIITIIIFTIIIPLNLSFQSTIDGTEYSGSMKLGILLNLITGKIKYENNSSKFSLRLASIQIYESKSEKSSKGIEEKPKIQSKRRGNPINIIKPITVLLKSIIEKIQIKKMDIFLNAGFDDPYSNGLIFGLIYPFIEIIKLKFQNISILVQPEFIEEKFYAELDSNASFRIISISIPFLKFYFSNGFREYRKSR